ncbi:class I adenylate-forming enzyme family protein [Tepidamorphus sp. 3E244]|uniref:class I adenylate-forming enzyme family protein n=1 Tax=Tepidamorphus sp. 3E244 TaxID=3385498 RepID=UPI0038FD1BB5
MSKRSCAMAMDGPRATSGRWRRWPGEPHRVTGNETLSISARRYVGALPPQRFNMAAYALARGADDKPAIRIFSGDSPDAPPETLTYGALRARVRTLIAGLNTLDLPPFSVVAIRQKTGIDYAASYLAVAGAGHVALAMSPMLTARETDTISATANVRAFIRDEGLPLHDTHEVVASTTELEARGAQSGPADFADTAADDPAYLVFTSGTGAAPKGVLHAHRAAFGRQPMYADWYGANENDVFFHTGAMNWTYSLGTGLVDPLVLGATATFVDKAPDASAWGDLLARSEATVLATVPGLYRQMLRAGLKLGVNSALRHGLTAGEALRAGLHADWQAATGRRLCEAFGMSEISTYLSTGPHLDWREGSPGRPQTGRAVAVLPVEGDSDAPVARGETGVLCVHRSDPGMMLGYLGDSAELASWRGDWFLTGDLAVMDANGYIFPQGRADDVMNVMGYRVSPAEVEAQLLAIPGVLEVAVTAQEPREGVSIIVAYLVAAPQVREAGAEPILKAASERLARYKQPREVVFVEALPRTPNGKVQRSRLGA